MGIITHKTSIMSFFTILFKCSDISSLEVQVCNHDRTSVPGLWGEINTSLSLSGSNSATGFQRWSVSLGQLFTNYLLFLILSIPPSQFFKTQYIALLKYLPFKISVLSRSPFFAQPPSFSSLSWTNFKKDMSTPDFFISSAYGVWLLLPPKLQNIFLNSTNGLCIGQIQYLLFCHFI